jgi:hypothetical protein
VSVNYLCEIEDQAWLSLHIYSQKNTPEDECLHLSPLGERIRFYSKAHPPPNLEKIQIEL